MKEEFKFLILITICLSLIVSCLWLTSNLHKANDNIKSLSNQIEEVRQKNHNDSVLLYEYQEALDRYRKIDPLSASDFSKLIEQINNE